MITFTKFCCLISSLLFFVSVILCAEMRLKLNYVIRPFGNADAYVHQLPHATDSLVNNTREFACLESYFSFVKCSVPLFFGLDLK
jgi:hypothetical protein